MCHVATQPHIRYSFKHAIHPVERLIADKANKTKRKTFSWLMEHLLPINEKFKGCALIFPDTVIFKAGKPTMLIRCDKEWCLTAIKN